MSPCECEHFSHVALCPSPAASQLLTPYGPFRLCKPCHAAGHMVVAGLGRLPDEVAVRRSARLQAEGEYAEAVRDHLAQNDLDSFATIALVPSQLRRSAS